MSTTPRKKSSRRRARAIRTDATVGTAELQIAKQFKLPPGSVKLVLPSGRDARSDKKIGNLLEDYGW